MPGVVVFKRKWLIAEDDLVIPYFLETILRFALLVPNCLFIWMNAKNCYGCKKAEFVHYFLCAMLLDLMLTLYLCAVITWLSSRGTVMQTSKRSFLSKLIYLKVGTGLFDLFIACSSIWLIFFYEDIYSCIHKEINVFLQITAVCVWGYFSIKLICIMIFYNSLGARKFSNNTEGNSIIASRLLRKAAKIWENRLKIICCCLSFRKHNHYIYQEISTFIASFMKHNDLVPTDVLAGLIILSRKHASERRRTKSFMNKTNAMNSLSGSPRPEWMTIENALYFLRLAKSTYGWLMFFDTSNPFNLCALKSHLRCCGDCFGGNKTVEADNCCYCNSAALQIVTGFSENDLLYISYQNDIYQPAFFVAIDHRSSSVVLGIRGTSSFSDLVTDIDADYESFRIDGNQEEIACHRGTLRSARYIKKRLTELKVLKTAFAEFPNYSLTITGHSLGGGIGTVLGFLLRAEYPNLRCYAFGPLAVLCAAGIKMTLDFTFSVVLDDDIAPRLSVHNCEKLRSDIVYNLQQCSTPKYKLLLQCFCGYLCNKRPPAQKEDTIYCNENAEKNALAAITGSAIHVGKCCIVQPKFSSFQDEIKIAVSEEPQLYSPGRILFLERSFPNCRYSWATGLQFDRIIVSRRMLFDHQPHAIQAALESVKDQFIAVQQNTAACDASNETPVRQQEEIIV